MVYQPPIFAPGADGIDHPADECVLVGPPGTGKTTQLLQAWLIPGISRWGSQAILACSYTKAAAREMSQRLAVATGRDEKPLQQVCSTIHAECYRLIGRPKVYGAPKPKPDDDPDPDWSGWAVLAQREREAKKEALRLWDLGRHLQPDLAPPADGPPPSMAAIEAVIWHPLRDGGQQTKQTFTARQLAAEIADYEATKRALGQIDFTDMLLLALAAGGAPERELLLVDEAQDLSPLQTLLVRQWAALARQLVWIGDPDQGIYVFAGADGEHLTSMLRRSGEIRSRRLAQSWRVPAEPHKLARRVIALNRDRVDSPYDPADRTGTLREGHMGTLLDQASGSVLVLSRTCKGLARAAAHLEAAGEPFSNERGGSPLKQEILISVILAVQALIDGRSVSRAHALRLAEKLPARTKAQRATWFRGTKTDAQTAIRETPEGMHLNRTALAVAGLRTEAIADTTTDPGELRRALDRIGLLGKCGPILRILDRYGTRGLTDEPRFVLTTIHASKGREADTVVLDLTASYWTDRRDDGERRVLYVALTRCRHSLYLAHADGERDLLEILS